MRYFLSNHICILNIIVRFINLRLNHHYLIIQWNLKLVKFLSVFLTTKVYKNLNDNCCVRVYYIKNLSKNQWCFWEYWGLACHLFRPRDFCQEMSKKYSDSQLQCACPGTGFSRNRSSGYPSYPPYLSPHALISIQLVLKWPQCNRESDA